MKQYRCLYNHEMLINFITQSPKQSYLQDVSDEYIRSFVEELDGTQVDCLMLCPTAWRSPLWRSEIDTCWRDEDYTRTEPGCWTDLKFYERTFWRIRRYMKTGEDPVSLTVEAARKQGLDFFMSYRMNDGHHVWDRTSPLHGKWELEHPEFAIDPARSVMMSYYYQEVRDRMLALLTELCVNYQPDGLELDFMRSPPLFSPEQLPEGIDMINHFIRQVRDMLKRVGAGREIQLCVRVPYDLDRCRELGLDPVYWDREKLVEMLNISPYFCSTIEGVKIGEFRKVIHHARIYGENCHHTGQSTLRLFNNNILRKCTVEQYRTASHAFLAQGADGVSFFNFAYHRENCLGEPRRRAFPGIEPRFEILKNILDIDYLENQPKHYYLNDGVLPKQIDQLQQCDFTLTIHVPPQKFKAALLKIEANQNLWNKPPRLAVNGVVPEQTFLSGELFEPDTFEGLLPREHTLIYRVPLHILKKGANVISVYNPIVGEVTDNPLDCTRIELALYPEQHVRH